MFVNTVSLEARKHVAIASNFQKHAQIQTQTIFVVSAQTSVENTNLPLCPKRLKISEQKTADENPGKLIKFSPDTNTEYQQFSRQCPTFGSHFNNENIYYLSKSNVLARLLRFFK